MTHRHRFLSILAGAAVTLIALATNAPAAFATNVPPPGITGTTHGKPVPSTVHMVTTGGMAGWQITLIAVAAALVAATVAVLLDRIHVGRRATSATST